MASYKDGVERQRVVGALVLCTQWRRDHGKSEAVQLAVSASHQSRNSNSRPQENTFAGARPRTRSAHFPSRTTTSACASPVIACVKSSASLALHWKWRAPRPLSNTSRNTTETTDSVLVLGVLGISGNFPFGRARYSFRAASICRPSSAFAPSQIALSDGECRARSSSLEIDTAPDGAQVSSSSDSQIAGDGEKRPAISLSTTIVGSYSIGIHAEPITSSRNDFALSREWPCSWPSSKRLIDESSNSPRVLKNCRKRSPNSFCLLNSYNAH